MEDDMAHTSYSFEEFKELFGLSQEDAERIFRITGPARADIDTFMSVRARRHQARDWILDVNGAASAVSLRSSS